MKINEILNEAGEPENPSRRGFLKAMGAAGVAAAMPGTAMKALAEPAAAEVPVAAAAAAESTLLTKLWNKALDYYLTMELDYDRGYSNYDDEFRDDDEDDDWNEEIRSPQGTDGQMPWGEYYSARTTPRGRMFLWTSSKYGDSGILTYEKDGQIRVIDIAWDHGSHSFGEVNSSSSETDEELYYAYTNEYGDVDENSIEDFVDYVIDTDAEDYTDLPKPSNVPDTKTEPKSSGEFAADKPSTKSVDTTPLDIARLAGLAKKGYEKLDKLSKVGEPEEPAQTKPEEPKALPAPTKPEFDLTPDLKQKQAEPVKRKDKDAG